MLVSFESTESKRELFRNIKKLKNEDLGNIRISNDLTKAERDQEKTLKEEAIRKSNSESGEFIYRVRGPPWNRKIVKLAKKE